MLTAGLAAGQAQAYDFNDAHTTLHDYVIDSKGNHWTGPSSGSNGNSTVTTTYSGAAQYANTIILNNGGTLTSESETNAGEENLYVNSITVNDGGKIELTGANASGGGIQGFKSADGSGSATSGSLTVNAGGEVSVTKSQIQMGDISINGEGATVTVGGNIGAGDPSTSTPLGAKGAETLIGTAESPWKDNAGIYGGNSLSISNGAIANINAGGQIGGLNVTVSNATVNLAGTSGLDSINAALLMAYAC